MSMTSATAVRGLVYLLRLSEIDPYKSGQFGQMAPTRKCLHTHPTAPGDPQAPPPTPPGPSRPRRAADSTSLTGADRR